MNAVANGQEDILQIFLDILIKTKTSYCVVGGLAVNAYVEPVVSLDLDVVVDIKDIDRVSKKAAGKGFKVERFEHSVNLTSSKSDLRIQIQTDSPYQEVISLSWEPNSSQYSAKIEIIKITVSYFLSFLIVLSRCCVSFARLFLQNQLP